MSDIVVTTINSNGEMVTGVDAPVVDVNPEPVQAPVEAASAESNPEVIDAPESAPIVEEAAQNVQEHNEKTPDLAMQLEEQRARADKLEAMMERFLAVHESSGDIELVQQDAGGEPRREQYRSDQEWMRATIDYEVKRALTQTRESEMLAQKNAALNQREEAFRAEAPDYDAAVAALIKQEALLRNPAVGELIRESEVGPQLAYQLGKDPALMRELSGLSPYRLAARLGAMEAALTAPKDIAPRAPAAPKVSSAPKPASPVSGGQAPPAEWDPNAPQDYESYKRNELKRLKSARS